MTVAELERRLSVEEAYEWAAWIRMKNEAEAKAAKLKPPSRGRRGRLPRR